MSASVTRKDRVLSVREREKFRREIKDREMAIRGHLVIPDTKDGEGMSTRRQGRWESFMTNDEDKGILIEQIRHMKRVLDKGSPRDLSRREKQVLEKQATEDREYFKRHMVPQKVYQAPSVFYEGENRRANPNFDKAQKAVFEREVNNLEFQKRANRYKNNMRELDPDNPNSSNIEQFRPKK